MGSGHIPLLQTHLVSRLDFCFFKKKKPKTLAL